MALGAVITEFPFASGQDEGTERAVLPVGQFSSLQNARYRKNRRLGKRYGYTSHSSTDAGGAALGDGHGRLSCLGPTFCAVDDQAYLRDFATNTWARVPASSKTQLRNKFPEFMPTPAMLPLSVQSDLSFSGVTGTTLRSLGGVTYAQGYVWTCASYFSRLLGAWKVRVVATDPNSGDSVFQTDVDTPVLSGEQPSPVLLSLGNGTVVLITDRYTAGTKTGVDVSCCTGIGSTFTSSGTLACIQSAFNYSKSTTDQLMVVYALLGTPIILRIGRINPVTMAIVGSTYNAGGNVTQLSVFENASAQVWAGFNSGAGLFAVAFTPALVFQGGNDWLIPYPNALGPITFTEWATNTVMAVGSSSALSLITQTVTSVGVATPNVQQYRCEALSQPFTVENKAYIWVRHVADDQLGVATLTRIPDVSEYTGVSVDNGAWPVNATVDDRDIDAPATVTKAGATVPTPVATPLGYTTVLDATTDTFVASSTRTLHSFLLTSVRHRSEGLRYSPSLVVPCSGKHFVPGAQPMWVDHGGAYEAGFIQAPVFLDVPVALGGGALTAGSAYSYVAYYEATDALGNIERSGTAVPTSISAAGMGANTQLQITVSALELGCRSSVVCKIFRTLANGSVYYLAAVFDATPGTTNYVITFNDVYADTDIIQNGPVYTQVGQELDASQFPACTFAATGNGRLLCAGGFNGRVGQFSKPFMPHLVPEFADDDAFRVTLPSDWTGAAFCDNWVAFTQEGIYIISGEGPDAAGVGAFSPATRLPFNIGCIEPRSVVTSDLGVWFQSSRGLYLLPRGFGEPVSMDQVLDTLTTDPIITSARSDHSSQGGADTSEQIIQWTCVSDEAATTGKVITYDSTYRAFYVDAYSADYPATFSAGWLGDAVLAPATMTVGTNGASYWHPFRVRNNAYSDGGLEIDFRGVTGDIRPFGEFAHGIINRVGILGELRTACTFEVRQKTDRGEGPWRERIYDLAAGDDAVDQTAYIEVPLGLDEQRDVVSLRVSFHESSTVEGFAPFGLYIERQKENQGWRLLNPKARVNVRADAILLESGAEVLTTDDGEQVTTEDGT